MSQLVQSLDEAAALAGDVDVAEVLRELRATALEPLMAGCPSSPSGPCARAGRRGGPARTNHPAEVMRLLRAPPGDSLAAVVALSGRLGLQQAVPGLGELLAHREPSVRLATVQALEKIASPGALTHIDRAIEDDDRAVRLQAVRAVGTRGTRGRCAGSKPW